MGKTLLHYIITTCFVLTCGSCVNLAKIREYPPVGVEVTNRYLQQKDDALNVGLDVKMPDDYRNMHTGIRFYPVFVMDGGQENTLRPFVIEGYQHDIFIQRMKKLKPQNYDGITTAGRHRYGKDAPLYHYEASVPFDNRLKGAPLYVDLYADAYTKEVYLGRILVSNGFPDLTQFINFKPAERYYYDVSKVTDIRGGRDAGAGNSVVFKFDSSDIPENNGADMALREYLEHIRYNPEVKDYDVLVYVSNSPEGSIGYNRELGQKRLAVLKQYVSSIGIPENKCTFIVVDEAWDMLLEALPGAGLKNRADIEEIIHTAPDFDERERLIRTRYYDDYQIIRNEIYPRLRRGEVIVSAEYKGAEGVLYRHVTEEINTGTGNKPVSSFTRTAANDAYTMHALMLDAVKNGETEKANAYADSMSGQILPDVIRHNMATLFVVTGRTEEAKALFATVASTPESRYNLGLLQLIDGEFAAAVENLREYSDINSAIARLYAGDNQNAVKDLLVTGKSAERDYLLALAYARMDKPEKALPFLADAINVSPELKAKARQEPDFKIFAENGDFLKMIN